MTKTAVSRKIYAKTGVFKDIFMTLLSCVMISCLPYSPQEKPTPPVRVPARYGQASEGNKLPERWWKEFNDPKLNRVVQRALQGNLELRAAWERVSQAKAIVAGADAAYWPQVNAQLDAARTRSVFNLGDRGVLSVTANRFSASLPASYEVDLWGRIGAESDAAEFELKATRKDFETLAMSVAAEASEAWFDWIRERAQNKLLSDQLKTNETFLELVELRFKQSLASAVDVYQQRQLVIASRASLAQAVANQKIARHRLAVLLGKAPSSKLLRPSESLPALPPLPSAGIPTLLLKRRPDVRAAQLRVAAADHRVGAAIAARFPSLTLSGSVGFNSPEIPSFFDFFVWNILGGITAPIIDGGRRSAEVDRNKAVVRERVHQFGQVLLQAMMEVENTLALEKQNNKYIDELEEQLKTATATLREARARYANGLSDFLPVLTSLQSLQQLEQNILTAKRQLLSYRIQLCRALGGTWVDTFGYKKAS